MSKTHIFWAWLCLEESSGNSQSRAANSRQDDNCAIGSPDISEITPKLEYVYGEFMADIKIRNLTAKTERYYMQQLRPFLRFCSTLHAREITDVGAFHIRQYLSRRRDDGLADNSIRAAYRAIKAFLNFCVQEDVIEKSPMLKVRMPKSEKKILPAHNMDDVARLIDACDCERDRAIVMTLVDTGIRSSELIGMTGGDVDLADCRICIHGKGRKDRYVFIAMRTRQAITTYYDRRGMPTDDESIWLGTTKPRPLTQSGLRQLLERLGIRTGIDHTNPHSFRRTFAITCLRNGMDIFKLSRLMGHEDIAILRAYLPLADADSRAAHEEYGPLNGLECD